MLCIGFCCAPGAIAATYDAALSDALAKKDANICDGIDVAPVFDDYGVSVEQAQAICRIAVNVASGKPENCMGLGNKRRSPSEPTEQHLCLQRMAQSSKRPEICTMIQPEQQSTQESLAGARCRIAALVSSRDCRWYDDNSAKQVRLFRDNCRVMSISDLSQCTQGFYDPATRKRIGDPDQCVLTVASNLRDAAICAHATSAEKRSACEKTVNQWQQNDKQPTSGRPSRP